MCNQPGPVRVYVLDPVHYVRQNDDLVTADVSGVLDGDLDALLKVRIVQRALERRGD